MPDQWVNNMMDRYQDPNPQRHMRDHIAIGGAGPGAVIRVTVDTPIIGGKCFLLEKKGIYWLEDTPGTLRTIACTHAGSGSLIAIDGIPNEEGFFPDQHMPPDDPNYYRRNGRPIYRASAAVMGSWMLDGGFHHGLVIQAVGGSEGTDAIASIVWLPAPINRRKLAG